MRRNIPPLTSLRFIAAMWVFLFHVSALIGPTGVKPIDNSSSCLDSSSPGLHTEPM